MLALSLERRAQNRVTLHLQEGLFPVSSGGEAAYAEAPLQGDGIGPQASDFILNSALRSKLYAIVSCPA